MASSAATVSVEALLKSGIFERHWYMAQCGVYFHNSVAAATHFIEEGMPQEASPNPLMEPRVWPGHLREAWKQRKLIPVLRWFQKPKAEQPAVGPLFEARYLNVADSSYATHPGGSLGYFLEHADDAAVLPTRFGDVDFGALKASWPAMYARLKKHKNLLGPREVASWDEEAEAEWLRANPPLDAGKPAPRFSVVMPTWNRSAEVASAIRSVQSQTHGQWELIVVDDGSTDTTRDVVRAMAAADSRIRLLEMPHAGVSRARNAGIDAASGELVAFLDSDNAWRPHYLEYMARGFAGSATRAAYAGLELHDGPKTTYRAFKGGLDHLLTLNHIDLNVLVVERDLAQEVKFDESIRRWVDHDFAIRVAKKTELDCFPFVGCAYDDDRAAVNRITTTESDDWQWVVLGKNVVDWDAVPEHASVEGRVSVVIPIYQDWSMTLRAVIKVLANSGDVDIEVLLIDNGSAYYYGAAISQFFAGEKRVRYARLARNMNFSIGSNYGAALASGEFVCFLNNDTEVRPGWLAPLVARLLDAEVRGVQPLLQYPDDTIQTAGTVFPAPRSLPTHFLSGLPPEDADGVEVERFSAVTAACLLMRRSEIASLGGFDPIFVNGMEDVDLCLRAIERLGGHFAVEPRSRVTHHESKTPGRGKQIAANRATLMDRWRDRLPGAEVDKFERAGYLLAGVGGDKLWNSQPRAQIVRAPGAGRTRWGIRHSAIGGERGDRWGDTYYVDSLAAALRAEGQEVVTYRHGANTDTLRSYDDINLVIRGLDSVTPIPGQVNVLWVISHPEQVSVEEVSAFDVVYASSASWARMMSERSGATVRTLYQATDTRVFRPVMPGESPTRRPTTFVGAHFPQRARPTVVDAMTSGIDMRVIGHGWRNLPGTMHEAEQVANAELGEVYRGAERVLADHWPDMAEMGFIQNRIFDAVACGTPVISDHVDGLDAVFGSLVQVYSDVDHLRYLASPAADAVFGSPEERQAQAEAVVAEHSFAARARTLVADAEVVHRNLFGSL